MLTPSLWVQTDFPIVHPNTLDGTWPVTAITRDARTGVWSATIPLPSGLFSYGFVVNCPASTGTGDFPQLSDPSNRPWKPQGGLTTGSIEPDSEVFVPSDPAFTTVNYSCQAPNSTHGARGRLLSVLRGEAGAKAYRIAVYIPPGYNPNRSRSYPTLCLSHGYGGTKVDWSTSVDAPTSPTT